MINHSLIPFFCPLFIFNPKANNGICFYMLSLTIFYFDIITKLMFLPFFCFNLFGSLDILLIKLLRLTIFLFNTHRKILIQLNNIFFFIKLLFEGHWFVVSMFTCLLLQTYSYKELSVTIRANCRITIFVLTEKMTRIDFFIQKLSTFYTFFFTCLKIFFI